MRERSSRYMSPAEHVAVISDGASAETLPLWAQNLGERGGIRVFPKASVAADTVSVRWNASRAGEPTLASPSFWRSS